MTLNQVIDELNLLADKDHLAKLARFGIESKSALGVKIPDLRKLSKKIGKNQSLAEDLWWKTNIHEAHLLAPMIAEIDKITETDFDKIVKSFYSWDLCDCTCYYLSITPFAEEKIFEYADNEEVFVKRTAFVLMCDFAVYGKQKSNEFFYPLFDLIEREAWDERNFVRKAVNWALRQIGKRNEYLRLRAIETAERILQQNTKSARWIATDALRELRNEKVIARTLKSKK